METICTSGARILYYIRTYTKLKGKIHECFSDKVYVIGIGLNHPSLKEDGRRKDRVTFHVRLNNSRDFLIEKVEKVILHHRGRDEAILEAGVCLERDWDFFCEYLKREGIYLRRDVL